MARLFVNDSAILSQHLLISVAEELKLPLVKIARSNEQNELYNYKNYYSEIIKVNSDTALQLLDNYILAVKLAIDPKNMNIESVSISSVLYDTSEELYSYAKLYGVDLELSIASNNKPVAANRAGLQAALISLGAALIEAIPAHETKQLKLQLASHYSRYGMVAGVYSDIKQLCAQTISSGRKLQKQSRQPHVNLTYSAGAGIFVADSILKAMDLKLISSRHNRLYGIGTVIKPINQLQFI